jgi:hypothetical protein
MEKTETTGIAGAQDQSGQHDCLPTCLCQTERGIVARVTRERDDAVNALVTLRDELATMYKDWDLPYLRCETAIDAANEVIAQIEGSK